jgi:hypothetical protein
VAAWRTVLVLFLSGSLCAQTPQVTPQQLFNKVRELIAAIVSAAPRYTCVQTVERTWFDNTLSPMPGCAAPQDAPNLQHLVAVKQDRLRLDVGVVGADEVFSWHGENQFKTTDLGTMVSGGPITSGVFFSLLADIFVNGRGHYFYKGARIGSGGKEILFEYSIPRKVSHYSAATVTERGVMGYHGRFTVDAASGELLTLEVVAEDIPRSVAACNLSLLIRYQTLPVNGKLLRIPQAARMTLEHAGHDTIVTNMHYSGCHEFVGESVIHFESFSATTRQEKETESGPVRELPSGLHLKLRLASPVTSEDSWTGDPVRAIVISAVRSKSGQTVVPQGALVTGRVVQLEHDLDRNPSWTVVLRFDRIRTDSGAYKTALRPKSRFTASLPPSRQSRPDGIELGAFTPKAPRGSGGFQFSGDHLKLDGRFVSDWETMRPAER